MKRLDNIMTKIKDVYVNSSISWHDIKFALICMAVGAAMAMLVVIYEARL